MSRTSYLFRRGDVLTFRISVPVDLRSIVGVREITKTLHTSDRCEAVPIALEYAAIAKRLFFDLRAGKVDFDKALEYVRLQRLRLEHQAKIEQRDTEHADEIKKIKQEAQRDKLRDHIKIREQQAQLDGFREAMATLSGMAAASPAAVIESPSERVQNRQDKVPTLRTVVDDFFREYPKGKKVAMLQKHRTVLPMFLEVVGDKPVADITQADVNEFFELVLSLPPHWKNACRRLNVTIRDLAEMDHDETISPKTLKESYKASVRLFLEKKVKPNSQDRVFPAGLTVKEIKYGDGGREVGEHKQRAFKPNELKRLFEGPEMQAFAADKSMAHCYWLPHVGLCTGARVNEICQINPQTDVLQDVESGIWYFWMTAETPADDGVTKSIKTGDSRRVPLHPKLVELGFLDYVKGLRDAGEKRLFPQWSVYSTRASGKAEKWFRQFLRDTGLRDETKGATLTGMHAFRHTLLSYGVLQKMDLTCITGHEIHRKNPVGIKGAAVGYLDESLLCGMNLLDAKALLDQLDYGINFHKVSHS